MNNQGEGYQGEDWVITLEGDDTMNLDNASNFIVYVYPCGMPDNKVSLQKSNFERLGSNLYKGVIPYSQTSKFQTSVYSIEVMLTKADGGRAVFVKKRAMFSDVSASKDVL